MNCRQTPLILEKYSSKPKQYFINLNAGNPTSCLLQGIARSFSVYVWSHFRTQGAQDLVYTLKNLDSLKKEAKIQDESCVTKAPKIAKNASRISFAKQSNMDIFRVFRALGAKVPLFSTFRKKKIQLLDILDPSAYFSTNDAVTDFKEDAIIGSIVIKNDLIFVKCAVGWLPVKSVRVEGKRDVGAKDFRNGYQIVGYNEHLFDE